MRAPFQAGAFPAPVKYGYASVGIVERGPGDLQGRHVFVAVPASDALRRAGIGRPSHSRRRCRRRAPCWRPTSRPRSTACGMRARRSAIASSVVGAGTVGCLVAWLAGRIPGCDVELVDINPKRAAVARRSASASRSRRRSPAARMSSIHASGSAAGLELALRIAGVRSDDRRDELVRRSGGAAAARRGVSRARLTIKSSQVGSVASSQRARWDFRRRMAARAGDARRPGARRAHHRRERRSTRCRR